MSPDPTILDSLFNLSSYVATYDPRNSVLDNLINSGQINIIQNHKLKLLLTNWEGALAELCEHEQISFEITIEFASNTLITSNFDMRNINRFNYSNYLEGSYHPLERSKNKFDYSLHFKSNSLFNYLSVQNDMAQFAKIEADSIFSIIDEILQLIDFELNN